MLLRDERTHDISRLGNLCEEGLRTRRVWDTQTMGTAKSYFFHRSKYGNFEGLVKLQNDGDLKEEEKMPDAHLATRNVWRSG